MNHFSKVAGLLCVIFLAVNLASAQAPGTQTFLESMPGYDIVTSPGVVVDFIDSMTGMELNSIRDVLILFAGPFVVNLIMMWYVFRKVLKIAEASLLPGVSPGSIKLSNTGSNASAIMAILASFALASQLGLLSPAIAAISLAIVMMSAYFTQDNDDDDDDDDFEARTKSADITLDSGGL